MRDFDWSDTLWAVVKEDGSFAGVPCLSYEEAREVAAQHEGARIFAMDLWGDENDEPDDIDCDEGFDPYEGCFTYDC